MNTAPALPRMTAREPNEPASDNSTHGHRHEDLGPDDRADASTYDKNQKRSEDILADVVSVRGGWLVLEEFIADLGLERDFVRNDAEALATDETRSYTIVDVGAKTLLVGPDSTVPDAVAELFDRYERQQHAGTRFGHPGGPPR